MQRADTVVRHVPSPLARADSPASSAAPRHSSVHRSLLSGSSSLSLNGPASPYYVAPANAAAKSPTSSTYVDTTMPGGFPETHSTAGTADRDRADDDDDDDDDDDAREAEARPSVISPDQHFFNGYGPPSEARSSSDDYARTELTEDMQRPQAPVETPSATTISTIVPPAQPKPAALTRIAPGKASMRIPDKHADEMNSAFYTPVPTNGNPTDVLSQRFAVWRKVLKETVAYFEEAAVAQDTRSKAYGRLVGVVNVPFRDTGDMFLRSGGIQDTTSILRDYHKQSAYHSADAAKQITEQIVPRLKDLRRDLSFKIKEIKGLAGDFKNSVAKEQELTKKQVSILSEALSAMAVNPHLVSGKYDPYIVKMAVEKQLRKQIEEENYLHQAYLNIESSGKALEEIVVKEIQQAFDRYCSFLNREGQETLDFAHRLTINMVELPPTKEWNAFVLRDPNFVDPSIPVRKIDNIVYPGRDSPATRPIRSGPLERRTKYLKSYTSAWYVLTPLYLHEFKTSDRKNDLTPVMSLLLQDCHLSDHSDASSRSFKFLMKGKQSGQFHRGHSWMFRAESYEQMMVWYNDIAKLTDVSEDNKPQNPVASARPSSEYYSGKEVRRVAGQIKRTPNSGDDSRLSYDSSGSGVETNH